MAINTRSHFPLEIWDTSRWDLIQKSIHKTREGHANEIDACKLYTNAVGDPTALRSCIYNNPACCLLSKPRLRHNVTNGNQIYDAMTSTYQYKALKTVWALVISVYGFKDSLSYRLKSQTLLLMLLNRKRGVNR